MKRRDGILCSLLIIISLTGCMGSGANRTYDTSTSTISSVQSTYQPANSYVSIIANFAKWQWHRLPEEDRRQQEQALFFALDNVENGQSSNWYNNNTGTNGKIMVMSTFPMGSGYCRTVISRLQHKGKMRDFKETACKETGHTGWRFVKQ